MSNLRLKFKNDADETVSVVSLIAGSRGYNNGIQMFGLLMEKIISVSKCETNDMASLIFLNFFQVFEATPTHLKIRRDRQGEAHS